MVIKLRVHICRHNIETEAKIPLHRLLSNGKIIITQIKQVGKSDFLN